MNPLLPVICFALIPTLAAIAQSSSTSFPNFRPVNIDTNIQIGYGLAVADVDGDSKPDILLADKKQFVWYRNPGWEKFVLAENLTPQDNVCIAATDINNDGKCEVAVGAGWNPGDTVNSGAVFYLVAPEDRRQPWKAVKLEHEPTVHRMRWVSGDDGKWSLVVAPLHGRGNKGGEGAGVKVYAYRPSGSLDSSDWKRTLIDESLHMTHNFDPVNWDNDKGQELLLGGKEGVFLLKQSEGKTDRRQISGSDNGGGGEVRLGKLKSEKFITVVEPMHGNSLGLYRPGAKADQPWARTALDDSFQDGHALACGDLDGDGVDEIVLGWRAMNKPGVKVGIKAFKTADAKGDKWNANLIDDNAMACEDLLLADLNKDGKLDIIAAGRATKNVKIYWNEGK